MAKIIHFCSYLVLILSQMSYCSISKKHLESLLSHIYFKGYDLIVSITQDSEADLLSWLKESNSSLFSIAVADSNFSVILDATRNRSRSISKIAVIIEFQNVLHLENQLKQTKMYYTKTKVPQPVYFVIVSSAYEELLNDVEGLRTLSLEFSINGDFYLFGEEKDNSKTPKIKKPHKRLLNDLHAQGFTGNLMPEGYGLAELYSLKNMTFLEPVDLRETSLLQKVIRRADFRKAPITAVAQFGYTHRANFSKNNSTFTTGYEVDQLNFLASSFNFTIVSKIGNGWIHVDTDNSLKGMGAQVIDKEADISISSSEMLAYRAAQLTFLHPTYYITIWGFFKQPASNSLRDIFINAFTLDLWLTMFATWFLIIMAMFALAIVKWKLGTLHENDKIVVQEIFIWAAGAICQQGWHVCPESGCMKIVFIFALITGLVSYVGYSAALVSILSVKVIPINSLSDLDLEISEAIKPMPFEQRSILSEEALKKLLTSQSAFLGVTDLFYPAARKILCSDLQVCKNIQRISISKSRPVQGGMFVRKRSSFADFFNHRILLMYERGIRYRLLEDYFRDASVMCLDLTASEKEPLGFNDVVTAYVILLLGYMISITIFVIEKLCKTNLAVDDATPTAMYYTT